MCYDIWLITQNMFRIRNMINLYLSCNRSVNLPVFSLLRRTIPSNQQFQQFLRKLNNVEFLYRQLQRHMLRNGYPCAFAVDNLVCGSPRRCTSTIYIKQIDKKYRYQIIQYAFVIIFRIIKTFSFKSNAIAAISDA